MEGFFAGAIMALIFLILLLITVLIIYLIALWMVFEKAGRKGWEAIIPFYNTWVLAEISDIAWWYALIIILSNLGVLSNSELGLILNLAALVANFFIFYNLSKKFHKSTGFAILMTIFPVVMIPMIGFSNSYQYDKNVFVSENGPIGANNHNKFSSSNTNFTNNSNYEEQHYCMYCGKQISVDTKYCGNCGNEIKR